MAFKLDKQTSQKQEFKKYLLRQFKVSSFVFTKLTFRLSLLHTLCLNLSFSIISIHEKVVHECIMIPKIKKFLLKNKFI